MKVCLIFRKKDPIFFSIEKVFAIVEPSLKKFVALQKMVVSNYSNGILSIFKNLSGARKSSDSDIYHITGDVHYMVLVLPRSKTVLTIHDCSFLYRGTGIKKKIIKWLFLEMPVKRARIVTVISEKSRQEVIKYSKCDPSKVIVIPNPLSEHNYYLPRPFNGDCPVILFIGSTPNKNLERVVEALRGILCKLVIIGKIDEIHQNLLNSAAINYTCTHGLTDQEVADQYAACDIMLFPSIYEGFGLPIIEAQKTGRPVITSSISPMKEVAGDGALLVDPFSVDSIRAGVLTIINDDFKRNELIRKGIKNVDKYKAETIAAAYLNVYKQVSGSEIAQK